MDSLNFPSFFLVINIMFISLENVKTTKKHEKKTWTDEKMRKNEKNRKMTIPRPTCEGDLTGGQTKSAFYYQNFQLVFSQIKHVFIVH